jgi:hypothetical protein
LIAAPGINRAEKHPSDDNPAQNHEMGVHEIDANRARLR